ncbi:hypothetical protein [Streptomyces sp. NPDC060194]|uniref:hypothetical protein n=1 Tax=Streptomyces sp. NPDC060194 TaxID=3347069 RepID=UPI00365C6E1E
MSLKEAAAREAYLKTLLDVVNDAYKAARTETQALLDTAAEETGARQVAASLPDGGDVATLSLSAGSAEARVVDGEAFTAWVIEHFGTEVERRFVTEVRAAFREKVLGALTASGGTDWPDPETGVIHEVPGVQIAPARARTHSLRFKKDGRDQVMAAWREGRLAAVALPQLTAGGAA